MTPKLKVDVDARRGSGAPSRAAMTRWAEAALGRRGEGRELAVRVVAPRESQRLNAAYRGRNKPTNVLSFRVAALPMARAPMARAPMARAPMARAPMGRTSMRGAPMRGAPQMAYAQPLGDLVVCAAVVRDEARAQHKPVRAHWAHLIVHGALHLIGYDHENDADAARMERREIAVLRRLGYENPYRSIR